MSVSEIQSFCKEVVQKDFLHHQGCRYKLIEPLGVGSTGVVFSGYNVLFPDEILAIKVSRLVAKTGIDCRKGCYQQLREEAKFLTYVFDFPNVVKIKDCFFDRIQTLTGSEKFCCVVTEFLSSTIEKVAEERTLKFPQIKKIIIDILKGIEALHAKEICHADLTSSNVGLAKQGEAKIFDFGLSAIKIHEKKHPFPVQALWFRAPEAILGAFPLTNEIDTWSIGCILVELITGKSLFYNCQNPHDMLKAIHKICGPIPRCILDNSLEKGVALHYEKNSELYDYEPTFFKEKIRPYLKDVDETEIEGLLDLLMKLLQIDPKKRISAIAALHHPIFCSNSPNTEEEKSCNQGVDLRYTNFPPEMRLGVVKEGVSGEVFYTIKEKFFTDEMYNYYVAVNQEGIVVTIKCNRLFSDHAQKDNISSETAQKLIEHAQALESIHAKYPDIATTKIIDIFKVTLPELTDVACIVYENIEGEAIFSARSNENFSLFQIRVITKELLKLLSYYHAENEILGQIYPDNLMLPMDWFGVILRSEFQISLDKITQKRYRAPEIVSRSKPYTTAVDLWSLGHTLIEIIVGEIIVLKPDMNVSDPSVRENIMYNLDNSTSEINEEELDLFINLLGQLLERNPAKRITALDAIKHPFFNVKDI